jgi:hypothetical protein
MSHTFLSYPSYLHDSKQVNLHYKFDIIATGVFMTTIQCLGCGQEIALPNEDLMKHSFCIEHECVESWLSFLPESQETMTVIV